MIRFINERNLKLYRGAIALLRIDLNIEKGEEKKSYRIDRILPTLHMLLKNGNKVVLLSHRGRPEHSEASKGVDCDWEKFPKNKELSLKIFAPILKKKIKRDVHFCGHDAWWIEDKRAFISSLKEQVILLENLRFVSGEEADDDTFAKTIAEFGDFYINDAFAVSHRANASVSAITKHIPSFGGLLLQKEISALSKVMKKKNSPCTLILGGAKISDKIGLLEYFEKRAHVFLLGGGIANTFFFTEGLPMGESLIDESSLDFASEFLERNRGRIQLPLDSCMRNKKILDIGEQTVQLFSERIKKSQVIIWNGPLGLFELPEFAKGTRGIWNAILANTRAQIIVGGGETIASSKTIPGFWEKVGKKKNIFLSTGGGAMLEFLSGEALPGIEALDVE